MTDNCDTCAPPAGVAVKEDVMDPSTFQCPVSVTGPNSFVPTPSIIIEYCDRCRWQHRATWVQTELFLTFPPPRPAAADGSSSAPPSKASGGASIRSITLIPLVEEETGGRFRIWLLHKGEKGSVETHLVWDRKIKGGFPELKELKQLIRDKIAPQRDLGHSDKGAHGH